MFWGGPRTVVERSYTIQPGTAYPVAGIDISTIFNDFATGGLLHIACPAFVPGRFVYIDYTNKTLMLYTAISTAASDNTDQSSIAAIRVKATGYPA